jgi:hypothetical protein
VTAGVLVEPAYLWHPPYTSTLGAEVADLCSLAGFEPDPEQRLALDLTFALRPDGMSAAFEVAVICSRQNLKTGFLKQCALGWLFITDERLVVWSAHEFRTAQEAFRDLSELVEGCRWLESRVKAIHRGNGDEAIELVGDRRLIFKARTKGGGRGLSGRKVILDEAMFVQPVHMGALLPTLSAQPDPQVVYAASAGLAESAVLRGVRDRGRAGGDPRLAYMEHCDDLPGGCATAQCAHAVDAAGCRLDDRARWRRSNPAMGRIRANGTGISEEYIAAERRALTPAEFARERLGWWDTPGGQALIPAEAWSARGGAEGRPGPPVAFGIAGSWPDAETAAIGSAGRLASELLLQVVEQRPGVGWVVDRAVELNAHRPCAFVVAPDGPAGQVIVDLEAAGLEVLKPTAREQCHAAAQMLTGVVGEYADVRHYGQPELDASVADAGKHVIGDAWRWDRRGSSAALEAVTLAAHGHAVKGSQGAFFAAYR